MACIAEYCGIDAFSFTAEDIAVNTERLGRLSILENLKSLQAAVQKMEAPILVSRRLNQLIHRDLLAALIKHMIPVLSRLTSN